MVATLSGRCASAVLNPNEGVGFKTAVRISDLGLRVLGLDMSLSVPTCGLGFACLGPKPKTLNPKSV